MLKPATAHAAAGQKKVSQLVVPIAVRYVDFAAGMEPRGLDGKYQSYYYHSMLTSARCLTGGY